MARKRRTAVLRLATPEHINEDWFHARVADALAQLIKDVDHDENKKAYTAAAEKMARLKERRDDHWGQGEIANGLPGYVCPPNTKIMLRPGEARRWASRK